jgi:amidase
MTTANGTAGRGLHAPPVTKEILQQTAFLGGVHVPEKWEEDFTVMLSGVREAMEEILGQEGSVSGVD